MEPTNNDLTLLEMKTSPKTAGQILWEKKGIVFILTFTTLSVVFISTLLIKPVYQTNSKIMLKEESLNPSETTPSYKKNEEFLQDQAEIIKSRTNISKALESKILASRLLEQSDKDFIDIERLQKTISSVPINKTNILELKIENTDPSLAKSLSTALISAYSNSINTAQEISLNNSFLAIDSTMQSTLNTILEAEKELEEYIKKEGVFILPETEIVLNLKRFASFDSSLIDVDSEIQKVNTKAAAVSKELATSGINSLSLPFITNNQTINNLQSKLQAAEISLSNLTTEYTSFHPEVINAYKNIREIENTLEKTKIIDSEIESYSLEKKSLESKRKVLSESNDNYAKTLKKTLASQPKLSSMLSNLSIQRRIYEDLLSKKINLQILISRINNTSKIKIIDPPQIPLHPLRPNLPLNMLLGLFAGFALGCSFAISLPDSPRSAKKNKQRKELRNNLRFPLSTDIIYSHLKEPYIKYQAFSLNFSNSGLSFSSEHKPNTKDILNLEIQAINGTSIIAKGKVIWSHEVSLLENGRGPFNSGIKFTRIKPRDKDYLMQCCSRLSKV